MRTRKEGAIVFYLLSAFALGVIIESFAVNALHMSYSRWDTGTIVFMLFFVIGIILQIKSRKNKQ